MTTVAIIGAGFSGTILALNLLQHGSEQDRLILIERRRDIGVGQAYSTIEPHHLLNIPASGMSPFSDQPDAFVDFLAGHRDLLPSNTPSLRDCYAPRMLYGQFLKHLVATKLKSTPGRPRLTIIRGTAADIIRDDGNQIMMANGWFCYADRVVLASGNLPPSAPSTIDGFDSVSDFYIGDPWNAAADLDATGPDANTLILGTGLTAIDTALSFAARHQRGTIVALSSHGLLPHRQEPVERWESFVDTPDARSVRKLLRLVRQQIARAEVEGKNWQSVLNSLRPYAQSLWTGFPEDEQARFIRHVRSWWDVHRHRVAPAVANKVATLMAAGKLRIIAGRILRLSAVEDGFVAEIRPRAGDAAFTLPFNKIINCSGPNYDFATSDEILLKRLLESGRISLNAHKLGVRVSENFAAIGRDGAESQDLFAMGPMLRGQYWEINAVPEIVAQAEAMAQKLWQAPDNHEFAIKAEALDG
jgi:uncharacterized NAD(P)/FAD-binding protein YdhS